MNLFKFIKGQQLRTKFLIPISALLIASIAIVSTFLINRQAESYRREMETNGETMIQILADHAEGGVIFENEYELNQVLSLLGKFDDVIFASISGIDDRVLAQIGTDIENRVSSSKLTDEGEIHPKECNDFVIINDNGDEFFELNYPIVTRKQELGRENLGITAGIDSTINDNYVTEQIGSIKLVLDLKRVNEAIIDASFTAILITLVVLVLTILMLNLFVGVVTKPVQALVEITDQVSRGDLSRRVELNQSDEIGHLAETFNRMVDSLRQSRDEIEEYNRNLEHKIVERTLELEEVQAQLVQSEKLSAIGQLAAGVAHELNNPLGGILGYSQFALEKLRKGKTDGVTPENIDKFIRYLTDIETQARRCKTIVQNLLRFSRSSRTTEFTDTNVNQVIEDTRTFVEHQLHMNNIELDVHLSEYLPIIQGNAGQLQQVLTNLIINAMHASPPDSEIKIFSRFSPPLGEFGGAVEIVVADQGCGISKENIKKIFEPFFTTKVVGKGTGLGLSVSYGIIKDHAGEIKVDSVPDEGSTFIVVLPVQKAPEEADNQIKGNETAIKVDSESK